SDHAPRVVVFAEDGPAQAAHRRLAGFWRGGLDLRVDSGAQSGRRSVGGGGRHVALPRPYPRKEVNCAAMKKVHFETSRGEIVAELFEDDAPGTVANFVGLITGTKEWTDPKTNAKVKRPFYDGLTFHRVVPDFVIQGGCPLGTGTGGPGYTIKCETKGKRQ